ncbi:cytochrome c [Bdellovibrio bacteriovorus]|uniref:c-type cytochrome n=1 Tax=Bdellovibrio bacteriovorus TaxID=959 RepID=UPI0035A718FA
MKRSIIAVGAMTGLVVAFQNCSDFALQDQVIYEQGIFELDSKTIPALLDSESLNAWSKPGNPNFVNDGMWMADQWSLIVAADRSATGKIITVSSGLANEESYINIASGKIRAVRTSTGGAGTWSEYLETNVPTSGDKMVLAATFGAKAGGISLMVNGILQTATLQKSAIPPGDFSMVAKSVQAAPVGGQVYEYMVFGGDSYYKEGKLTDQQLNVMSRYIANNNMIANVLWDPSLTAPSSDGDEVNPKFVIAKAIYDAKCISCHKSGGNSPNLVNLSESKALSNGWVVKGNPQGSTLYNVLKGSSGSGAKSMPSGGSISAAEVQAIADWINSIK